MFTALKHARPLPVHNFVKWKWKIQSENLLDSAKKKPEEHSQKVKCSMNERRKEKRKMNTQRKKEHILRSMEMKNPKVRTSGYFPHFRKKKPEEKM